MKTLNLVVLVFSMVCLATTTYSKSYVAIGGGAGGSAEEANVSFEFGGTSLKNETATIFAIGFSIILNGGDVPSDTLDYPVPHNDYTDLGTKQRGHELGGIIKYGVEIKKNSGFFLYGLGGVSFAEDVELAQSNVTGWYYEQSSDYNAFGIFGGGICFIPKEKGPALILDIDNRRGITGSIGFTF